MTDKAYRVTPGPAINTATGRPAGAGDVVQIDPQDPANARLIEAGRLVEQKTETAAKKTGGKAADKGGDDK